MVLWMYYEMNIMYFANSERNRVIYARAGCGMHGHEHGYRRRFLTKAEKTEKLKNCAEELKKELKAVEERNQGNAELNAHAIN